MANNNSNPIFNADDTLDINELASLNNEISDELIEQLQSQAAISAEKLIGRKIQLNDDDSNLFEEVQKQESEQNSTEELNTAQNTEDTAPVTNEPDNKTENLETAEKTESAEKSNEPAKQQKKDKPNINTNLYESFDDNFIKKYKAKLNKQMQGEPEEEDLDTSIMARSQKTDAEKPQENESKKDSIEDLTNGNIVEKPVNPENIAYNDSLDFLDNNIKYSKYVIYIDPENTEFMESLTVKERKNLINRIIREQDDIALTKRKLGTIQTIIKHVIIAILTVTLSIPAIYMAINASLEATINNHRQSQNLFQTLYKEHGKIKNK